MTPLAERLLARAAILPPTPPPVFTPRRTPIKTGELTRRIMAAARGGASVNTARIMKLHPDLAHKSVSSMLSRLGRKGRLVRWSSGNGGRGHPADYRLPAMPGAFVRCRACGLKLDNVADTAAGFCPGCAEQYRFRCPRCGCATRIERTICDCCAVGSTKGT